MPFAKDSISTLLGTPSKDEPLKVMSLILERLRSLTTRNKVFAARYFLMAVPNLHHLRVCNSCGLDLVDHPRPIENEMV